MNLKRCHSIDLDWAVSKVEELVQERYKVSTACSIVVDKFNEEYPSSLNDDINVYKQAKVSNIRAAYYRRRKNS